MIRADPSAQALQAGGGGFDDQQNLGIGSHLPFPPIPGADSGEDIDAGGQSFGEDPFRETLRNFRGGGGDEDDVGPAGFQFFRRLTR